MVYLRLYESPLGPMTMASDGASLIGLWFGEEKRFAPIAQETPVGGDLLAFEETIRWLDAYFGGRIPDFTPPLSLGGTPFQKEIWTILLKIPYGGVSTYGEIASSLAKNNGIPRMSAQAVGRAVGCNPISLIVPCHRVLGKGGTLVGYAGGIDKKEKLLSLERRIVSEQGA